MIWANFLHIYQPPNQLPDILKRIVNESYRKIIQGMKKYPQARLTLNINGGLTELLAKRGYYDVIKDLKSLALRGQLEFTETAKYHTFFPLLPESEIVRQIKLNHQTNKKYFGKAYQPRGFFPPEMTYDKKTARIVKKLSYEWLIADEIAFGGKIGQADYTRVYTIKGLDNLKIFFKEQRLSNLIVGAVVRSGKSLLEAMGEERKKNRYLLTAMDGETFGHHRPGLDKLLFEIFASPVFKKVLVSEIPNYFKETKPIAPINSSWSTKEEDLKKKLPYKLWWQPDNPIHKLQWQFTNFVIKTVEGLERRSPNYKRARSKLDIALHSDHYWWASKYWWSLEIIEQGAYNLKETIKTIKNISPKIKEEAEKYYRQILDQAFEWQRTGYIRKFHEIQQAWQKTPFKKRTHAEWFNQMILEFEAEMRKAAQNQEYEKAIKWRDAIIKLKEGTDVYDVLHVVNELGVIRRIPSAKPFLKHKRFTKFAREHFLPLEKGKRHVQKS